MMDHDVTGITIASHGKPRFESVKEKKKRESLRPGPET